MIVGRHRVEHERYCQQQTGLLQHKAAQIARYLRFGVAHHQHRVAPGRVGVAPLKPRHVVSASTSWVHTMGQCLQSAKPDDMNHVVPTNALRCFRLSGTPAFVDYAHDRCRTGYLCVSLSLTAIC